MDIKDVVSEYFDFLDQSLNESTKDRIKSLNKDELHDSGFCFGLLIRSNWHNSVTSPLVKNFRNHGLTWFNEDDISAFIIKLYWNYLKEKSFNDKKFEERFIKKIATQCTNHKDYQFLS